MRCVGPDQTGATVTLHYLMDGTVRARLTVQKAEYFIPVMLLLKALQPTSAPPYSSPARTQQRGQEVAQLKRRCCGLLVRFN